MPTARMVVLVAALAASGKSQADATAGPSAAAVAPPPPTAAPAPPPHELTALEKVLAAHEGEEASAPDPVQPPGTPSQVLASIAQIQALIRRRQTTRVEIDTPACMGRMENDAGRWKAAEKLVGTDRLKQRTRYANQATNLGLTVDAVVWSCIGCSSPDDDEPVPHECAMALTALADLGAEVKSGK